REGGRRWLSHGVLGEPRRARKHLVSREAALPRHLAVVWGPANPGPDCLQFAVIQEQALTDDLCRETASYTANVADIASSLLRGHFAGVSSKSFLNACCRLHCWSYYRRTFTAFNTAVFGVEWPAGHADNHSV